MHASAARGGRPPQAGAPARLAWRLAILLPWLPACEVGYHFSGLQAIADPQGRVHAAAVVDIETEGGGGPIRVDLASFSTARVRTTRARLDADRLADLGLFVDGGGALVLVAEHDLGGQGQRAAPLARRTAGSWEAVAPSAALPADALVALADAGILGVGWTDPSGATRFLAPAAGLGGWVFQLEGSAVTRAEPLEPLVAGAYRTERPTGGRLRAWVFEPLVGCQQPYELSCAGGGCAWIVERPACLGRASSAVGHTAAGVPVAVGPARDPETGAGSIELAWPDGRASIPFALPADQVLELRLAPRAAAGLLVLACSRGAAAHSLFVLEEDWTFREIRVEAETGFLVGCDLAGGLDEAGGELAHVVCASHSRLTRVRLSLATGEQRRERLELF